MPAALQGVAQIDMEEKQIKYINPFVLFLLSTWNSGMKLPDHYSLITAQAIENCSMNKSFARIKQRQS